MNKKKASLSISAVALAITGVVASPAIASAESAHELSTKSTASEYPAQRSTPTGSLPNASDETLVEDQGTMFLATEYTNYKGFCVFGHNPNGSCRGASSAGAKCILGTTGGAGGGALGGAALGPLGAAAGAAAGGALAASGACFKGTIV